MNAVIASHNRISNTQPVHTHGQFVPAAARAAIRIPQHVLEDTKALQKVYEHQVDARRRISESLPFETDARTALARQLKIFERQSDILEGAAELDMPILDPAFLSWKTRAGFPGFSVFTVDDDKTEISFLGSEYRNHMDKKDGFNPFLMSPQLPPFMAKHYLDGILARNLLGHCVANRFSEVTLTAQYRGFMPDSVLQKIKMYRQSLSFRFTFEFIFIIAEAPDDAWQVKGIPQKDPLVVGVRKGILWLIDAYDLTPAEQFVKDLYSDPEAKPRN